MYKKREEKKREKNVRDSVCVSVLLTVKSDGERHGHRLKGNSTLTYIGPETCAALSSVG